MPEKLLNLPGQDEYFTEWAVPPPKPPRSLRLVANLTLPPHDSDHAQSDSRQNIAQRDNSQNTSSRPRPETSLPESVKKAPEALPPQRTIFKKKEPTTGSFRVIKNSDGLLAAFLSNPNR